MNRTQQPKIIDDDEFDARLRALPIETVVELVHALAEPHEGQTDVLFVKYVDGTDGVIVRRTK